MISTYDKLTFHSGYFWPDRVTLKTSGRRIGLIVTIVGSEFIH